VETSGFKRHWTIAQQGLLYRDILTGACLCNFLMKYVETHWTSMDNS